MLIAKAKWLLLGLLSTTLAIGLGHALADTSVTTQVCSTQPPTTIITPLDQSVTTDNPITFSGTAETGATYAILADGTPISAGTVPQNGVYSQNISLPLGTSTIVVRVTDACGGQNDSPAISVTRKVAPATQPVVSSSDATGQTSQPSDSSDTSKTAQSTTTTNTTSTTSPATPFFNPSVPSHQAITPKPSTAPPTPDMPSSPVIVVIATSFLLAIVGGMKWLILPIVHHLGSLR